jgi:hypothetical protein
MSNARENVNLLTSTDWDIATLRLANWGSGAVPPQVILKQNWNAGDGGGLFRYDASDTTTADNSGTVIVDAAGNRWKRQYTGGDVWAEWFGLSPLALASTNQTALQAASNFVSNTLTRGTVRVGAGQFPMATGTTFGANVSFRCAGKSLTQFITGATTGVVFEADQSQGTTLEGFEIVATNAAVTTLVGLFFDRCQAVNASNIRVFNCFGGYLHEGTINCSMYDCDTSGATSGSSQWPAFKTNSYGLLVTASSDPSAAQKVTGLKCYDCAFEGAGDGNYYLHKAIWIRAVDGIWFYGSSSALSTYGVTLETYANNSPLVLIYFIGHAFDTNKTYHFYSVLNGSFTGVCGHVTITSGYMYNTETHVLWDLDNTLGSGSDIHAFTIDGVDMELATNSSIIVKRGKGFTIDAKWTDIRNSYCLITENSPTGFRVQGSLTIKAAETPFGMFNFNSSANNIVIGPIQNDATTPAVARASSCGLDFAITQGGVRSGETYTIASATTLNLPASLDYFELSGTTTVTGLSASSLWKGMRRQAKLTGNVPFTDSAAFRCPGSTNFSGTAGDIIEFFSVDGVNVSVIVLLEV